MQTVAAAIREDLAKVKDVLDIYVRRGSAAPEELGPQIELLRKIGDTLGVLGLGEQRARVAGRDCPPRDHWWHRTTGLPSPRWWISLPR